MFYSYNINCKEQPMNQQLSATLEDYLETIFGLEQERGFARVRDISAALDVAKSAVTNALKSLSEKGLVNYEPYEPVTLSPEGHRRAGRIVLRHHVIEDFLENVLGLEEGRASSIACGMEHAIDRDALDRFVCFLAFVSRPREEGGSWLEEFRQFVREGTVEKTCEECMEQYLKGVGIEEGKGAEPSRGPTGHAR
ncbi:MAG: metal-dependent transcriptional regulator [Candidatus Brocadiaceae bacterium]|jgi:DtxR family Mn-dependent transcriptional regulator